MNGVFVRHRKYRGEELMAAQAKARQRGGQGGVLLVQNSAQASTEDRKTRTKIAKIAGVSHTEQEIAEITNTPQQTVHDKLALLLKMETPMISYSMRWVRGHFHSARDPSSREVITLTR